MRPPASPRVLIVLLGFCLPSVVRSAELDSVDFADDVLPILSAKCFACHGPDAKEDELRLDSYDAATRDLGGYRGIDPKSLEKSEVLARIHDADDPMPPVDADEQLTDAERKLLTRWVREGGEYDAHWAFVPPRKTTPPKTATREKPVDAFLLAPLERRGLGFAPQADRAALARRAALVLTGLPPEPEVLERFLADERSDAYERLVDTLLRDPRYGEHQARYWLDAVRYGDTHGLHLDNRRGIYPYRDWVVLAYNDNLPLDDFLTWQLAGDLLPSPRLEQLVATGFVRMNPTTAEGGVIPAEFQAKNNFDRVETLGTALLGMTLNCARCHSHKYDPIPRAEYYRVLAFFNSTAESPLDGNSYTYGPVIRAPENGLAWRRWRDAESKRDELLRRAEQVLASRDANDVRRFARERGAWSTSDWRIAPPVAANADAPPDADGWGQAKGLPGTSKEKLAGADKARWVAARVEVERARTLWLTFAGSRATEIRVDGEIVPRGDDAVTDRQLDALPLRLTAGAHQLRVKLVGHKSTAVRVELRDPWKAIADAGWAESAADDRLLALTAGNGPFAASELAADACRIVRQRMIARSTFTTTLVARDLPQPRVTKELHRGEYDRPIGEPLEPGIFAVMGAFPKDAPHNRLGLARWLTSREHPVVARVLVNRIWQSVFGHGLVRTPEDFGVRGQPPTHPELLDWLAVELHDSGWNHRHMLRLLVTSRAFRQSSAWRSKIDDPNNLLLARGPSFRLDAEVIRDIALWSGRLLATEMGGEGVKPYQPEGLWSALAHPASNTKRYERDRGERIYRRSLYVYWKRTSPHPMMTLFDAPSRESACVRRSRTSTPLQSLGLLNETQRLEAARKLAARLLQAEGAKTDDDRLDLLFRLLACRVPNDRERAACSQLLATMRTRYAAADKDALAVVSQGDTPRDETLDVAELAAWSQVAVTVLASDVALLLY